MTVASRPRSPGRLLGARSDDPARHAAIAAPRLTDSDDRRLTSISRFVHQHPSDVQAMTEQLRRGLIAKTPEVKLEGKVEIDEVYVVAGHKGQPAAVAKRGGSDAVGGWQAHRAAARWRRTSRPSSV